MDINAIFIITLSFINFALTGGLLLLALLLGSGQGINRQLAWGLLGLLAVHTALGILTIEAALVAAPTLITETRAFGVLTVLSIWLLVNFIHRLAATRRLMRLARIGLAAFGVSVAAGFFVPFLELPSAAHPTTLLSAALALYLIAAMATSVLLLSEAKPPLNLMFSIGLLLIPASLIPVAIDEIPLYSLTLVISLSAALLVALGLIRVRTLNGFENEPARLAIARTAGVSLTTRLELPALLEMIAQQAASLMGAPCACVYLKDETALSFAACFGLPPALSGTAHPAIGVEIARRALESRETVTVPDYQSWVRQNAIPAGIPPIHAAAAIPLIFSNEVVGVLTVFEFEADRRYQPQDLAVLDLLAPQAAIAIVNARAYAEIAHREQNVVSERDRLQRINATIEQLLAAADENARLFIVSETVHDLGWGRATILLFDKERNILRRIDSRQVAQPLINGAEAAAWHDRLDRLGEAERIGVGYYFAADKTAEMWSEGDTLFIPLRRSSGAGMGVIDLGAPDDNARPTEASLGALAILIAQTNAVLENSRLVTELKYTSDKQSEQVDELTMLQQLDEELSSTLNLGYVMTLTIDWALRRTGARAGLVSTATADGTGLIPLSPLGYPAGAFPFNRDHPMPLSWVIMGRAARTHQMTLTADVSNDPDYIPILPNIRAQIAIPLETKERLLGVLSLESDRSDTFNDDNLDFIQRLAARAVIAFDNARLYTEAERRAEEMSTLYQAGRAISSSLERAHILPQVAQSMAALLKTSSALVTDFRANRSRVTVLATYQPGTLLNAADELPPVGAFWELKDQPIFQGVITSQRSLVLRAIDPDLSEAGGALLRQFAVKALLLTPLVVQDEVLGITLALESRRDRPFTQDDILLCESLASQAAVALRQARLYDERRELETLKSEMIRMASHDLRTPLTNLIGYFDLLLRQIGKNFSAEQQNFATYIQDATGQMRVLIDDMLTLEKVESERKEGWRAVDLLRLVQETHRTQLSAAALKRQTLLLERANDMPPLLIVGSQTQLRQAIANLVNNAIKYTPEAGTVTVRVWSIDSQFQFEVEDTGYGIAPERQSRLFQQFYRARQPGTEDIPGTGLGLSLVKLVIERHGGEVWFKSAVGTGSTFGFWLPVQNLG